MSIMAKAKTTTKSTTKEKPSSVSFKAEINDDLKKEMRSHRLNQKYNRKSSSHTGSSIYFLGFIGAVIYYISTATGFWMGLWGVIKAIVWPAFLVYELFLSLGL